ncbi:MAG: glycosyltransferase family 4 protein [Pseudomonadota bacterium]
MRISFVLPHAGSVGGIRVVAAHAEGLQKRGHEVFAVSLPFPQPGPRAVLRHLKAGRLPPRVPKGAPFIDPLPIEHRVLDRVRPAVNADLPDADAVIATWWETAFAVASLSPAKGTKFHFVQHHEVFDDQPKHIVAGCYHLPLHRITVSGWLKDVMAERYGDGDVDVVPNTVDTRLFGAPARARGRTPTVGFIYSEPHFKGTDIVLAAIARIRTRIPNLRVIAFGRERHLPRLPLPPGVEFHLRPTPNEIPSLYAACDVFLMTSRSEGFGLPILEAMACRTPVVASDAGCARETLADGRAGHLVPVEDSAAVASAAVSVLEQAPNDWRAMSSAARARVEGYSWDDATALFEAALRRRVGR